MIFDAYDLAGLALPNRIVMAPMTRARAVNDIPDEMTALYYRQRASAGLIISEGVPVSVEGRGYLFNPAIHTAQQAAGWKVVTDAVHSDGGRIFAQLWHVGRLSHTSLQPDGGAPVSSTATRAATAGAFAYDETGTATMVPASAPRALATDEIARVTQDFVRAAKLAMESGFDGIEIHGANGYLFEQFINGGVNDRTDRYGGSITNRLRFLLETSDAISAAIGANHVGIRISPFGRLYDMPAFADEAETWLSLAQALSTRNLAYVHLSDQISMGLEKIPADFASAFRRAYRGTLMAAGGFDKATGELALQAGDLDLIAIGRPFIANPDLVERMKNDWPIVPADRSTFYGNSGARGYTDYPCYQTSSQANAV
jgi:N-ethylmaleimide reductase